MESTAHTALIHLSLERLVLPRSRFAPSGFSNVPPFCKPNKIFSSPGFGSSAICHVNKWAERLLGDFQFSPTTTGTPSPPYSSAVDLPPDPNLFSAITDRTLPMMIDFYQVLGAETHFLADGIRRAYEARVSKPLQCGFSDEVLIARMRILQVAWDTLSDPNSRGDYNRSLMEDPSSTLTTHVPWDKVPGVLCVLQEAGEAETVLQVGSNLLRERLPKPFKQDVVLAMTLAFVDLSRDAMSLNPPDVLGCCEALERALQLLQSTASTTCGTAESSHTDSSFQEEGASSLAPDLLAQIDDTLEEIAPRCSLELLALPLDDKNLIKRQEGLRSIRSILWTVGKGGAVAIGGGFTRESFMNEAFLHMTASEQIDLFAATPSNIPAESFEVYGVALALVAHAIMGKKPHLIKDATNLFEQLQQTKVAPLGSNFEHAKTDREIDFVLERGLCSLLTGEIDECLTWLGIDDKSSPYRNSDIIEFIRENSNIGRDNDPLPGICKLLETWLMEVVFPRFRDTQCVQFRLGDYYDDPTVLRYLEKMEGSGSSPLAAAAAIVNIGAEATAALGSVKLSALHALQKVFPMTKSEGRVSISDSAGDNPASEPEIDEPKISTYHYETKKDKEAYETPSFAPYVQNIQSTVREASLKIMCTGIAAGILTLVGLRYLPRKNVPPGSIKEFGSAMAENAVHIVATMKNLVDLPKMDAQYAEYLIRKWQNAKSQALGADHHVEQLPEVAGGQMLQIWTERAAKAAQNGHFWDYTLQDLTIDSVTISLNGRHAVVEATIYEAAKSLDSALRERDDSYSTSYMMRYEMACLESGWKIIDGAILEPRSS